MKQNRGFTLIELLIVIGITAIVGTILVSTISSTLRGSGKGDIQAEVRSEGNYVISSLTSLIQSASSFDGASTTYSGYRLGTTICNDGTAYRSMQFNGNTATPLSIGCPNAAGTVLHSFSSINTKLVEVSSCNLYCSQDSPADPPTVRIDFTLSEATTSAFQENRASIDFSTSVKMRNPLE